MATKARRTPEVHTAQDRRSAVRRASLLLPLLWAMPALAAEPAASPGVATAKVLLHAPEAAAQAAPAAICSVRIEQDSSELALLCRHELGDLGEVTLRRGALPVWTAPLASPFEATARLAADDLAALLAGELAIRIETAVGQVAVGTLDTPIFESGFDFFSLCEWDNYPCPSDGNVCTYDQCSPTGACSYVNHSVDCSLPHADGHCNNGICQIQSCDDDYSNCNITNTDGCEVNHRNAVVRPDDPENCDVDVNMIDNYAGDTVCGVICSSNFGNAHTFATRKGRGQAVFSALAEEKSSCLGSVEHRLDLIVPANVDYDLYVYRDCELVAWSTKQAGLQEVVTITEPESAQESDTFFYQIEVRYFDGASCVEWELQLTGYTC